ncbi:hypothetical protein [Isoptericola croceus]|uniref:hypothetical protein n=1 Tax=Isoptericola croceus TaxID=3031406 RepID=UPI0023F86F50|nr:hypothetical protein [Isoptericola croceus]
MLQIQLGTRREADPDDALGRTVVGWWPGMDEDEAWASGRGVWKLNADRVLENDEVQIVNTEGTVLAIARITGVTKHGDRRAVEGTLMRGDARVGKPTTTAHRSRNSVGYF